MRPSRVVVRAGEGLRVWARTHTGRQMALGQHGSCHEGKHQTQPRQGRRAKETPRGDGIVAEGLQDFLFFFSFLKKKVFLLCKGSQYSA